MCVSAATHTRQLAKKGRSVFECMASVMGFGTPILPYVLISRGTPLLFHISLFCHVPWPVFCIHCIIAIYYVN